MCVETQTPTGGGGEGGEGGSGGNDPDPAWACLGNFTPPVPEGMLTHNYRFELAAGAPGIPPANLAVKVCASLNADCDPPDYEPVPDETGTIIFETAPSFTGFMLVTGETDSDPPEPLMRTVVVLAKPIILPMNQKLIRVLSREELLDISVIADIDADFTRGTQIILTNDCLDNRSAGVRMESDEVDDIAVQYYFRGNLPDKNATETDVQGAGGFVNMLPGIVGVDAYRADTDEYIGSIGYQSEADTLTYITIGPSE